MNIWWILRTEFRRLIRSRIGRAAILAGVVIPLLYSSLYLYAFWDPYDQMNEFPVALVNLDQGGEKDGTHEVYGKELVETLVEENQFKWITVGENEARDGLEAGRYYLKVTIPPTFTQDVLSVDSDNPHQAKLEFVPNEGQNYIASTITKRLETALREELGNKFTREYIKSIFAVIGDAGNGLTQAADGATKLADGSRDVANGAGDLATGAGKLADGSQKLVDGTGKLANGATQLADGATKVADGSQALSKGAQDLNNGIGKVTTGAADLQKGATDISAGSDKVAAGLEQSNAGVKQVRDQLQNSLGGTDELKAGLTQLQGTLGNPGQAANTQDPRQMPAYDLLKQIEAKYNLSQDPLFQGALQKVGGVSAALGNTATKVDGSKQGLTQAVGALDKIASAQDQLVQGARSVAGGSKQLAQGATSLSGGMTQLSQGSTTLATKSVELANGAQQVASGNQNLATGATDLQAGSQELAKGTQDLAAGSNKLQDGSEQVADGSRTLADELTRATNDSKVSNPDMKAEVMANPVAVESTPIHPVKTYGMGFASYFIPLSLWVGSLVLYFILSMEEYRWLIQPVSSASIVLGKFLTLGTIGVAQAVLSSFVLTEVLGLEVVNTGEFYLFNILVSLMSIAIIGLLIARLGSGPGRFVAILLLVLQLTSSAGTFPIELVPSFFQAIHPFLPMSYGIEGLRSLIAIGDQARIWQDMGVIALILVVVLVIHIVTTRRTLKVKDLHEKDTLLG